METLLLYFLKLKNENLYNANHFHTLPLHGPKNWSWTCNLRANCWHVKKLDIRSFLLATIIFYTGTIYLENSNIN